ncbi:unnamed protein product [Haemonchus placei]|uniref:Uncharacterized protein n=1 Tax=Haemonchus placei TaxID=6290 RepID=A0A3P7ZWF9_HAEPC|nr:unnamed protein product [Haemonchus placei]
MLWYYVMHYRLTILGLITVIWKTFSIYRGFVATSWLSLGKTPTSVNCYKTSNRSSGGVCDLWSRLSSPTVSHFVISLPLSSTSRR